MFKQKILILIVLLATGYLLHATYVYWYADTLFKKENYQEAVVFNSARSDYWMKLAHSQADENNFQEALVASKKAELLSPNDVNLKKSQANLYLKLATGDIDFLDEAVVVLQSATRLAPTDAGLLLSFARFQNRTGDSDGAIQTLRYALKLKPNYTDASQLLAKLLVK